MDARREARLVLLACSIGFFWSQSSRAVLYSIMPALSTELRLDPAGVGLLTGTLYGGYVLGVLISPLLPWGRRRTVAGGFLLTAAGNLGFAVAPGTTALLLLAAFGGLGVGFYLPRGAAVIAEVFSPAERARAMSWHEVAANSGLMLGALYAGSLLLFFSWRLVAGLSSVIGLVAAVAFWLWVPDSQGRPAPGTHREPFRLDGRAPALILMGGAIFAILAGLVSMLPTIVHSGWAVAPAAAAAFAGWIRLGGVPGSLIGGWAADRFGRLHTLAATFVAMLVCLVALAFVPFGWLFGAAVFAALAFTSAASTAQYALIGDTFTSAERERVLSVVSASSTLLATVVTPIALGGLLGAYGARTAVAAAAVAPVIGLSGLGWFLARSRRQRSVSV